ncbi:hypothetical protein [Clostridium sp. AM58-1XD]|uniref:hypothetical protein n=1 Tax=Clostridium sp. AM58-1XD TaxID=2292307 RepID=UPI000E5243B6|nr:hypothetical protein [Clostridium sp. AM58-1XD]RGZ00104.1 hypothetical protein DXA13_05625 [Clostridium sp. AM58-1XD]
MRGIWKKAGVLLIVFIIAVVIYFIWYQGGEESTNEVYTSMDSESLPVVYPESLGREMNAMHGYRQDVGQTAAIESLTILPADRRLTVYVSERGDKVNGIRYEIRSLDGSRLVERTSLEQWEDSGDRITASLPIQNLLEQNKQYTLCLILGTEGKGEIRYYTRIMLTDEQVPAQMVNLAVDFSEKTFDYNRARDLVTYLETNETADNSSLGHVTIESSFSQLTWGGLEMEPVGEVWVSLKELDGIMGNVELNYLVRRAGTEAGGELYEVTENFTMKWNSQRIYMMNYERNMDQIFNGNRDLFSGKRILLGITNDDKIQVKKANGGRYITFVTNRDLWSFDQVENHAVKIFSFRSESNEEEISYNQHGIRAVSIRDDGSVDFLVYGYMNRGSHEGMMGAAFYRYDKETDTIEEKFFFPVNTSYERLKQDIEELSYLGDNDMFYIMISHAVYGIDLKSNEYMVVADALEEGSFTISADGSHLAWQEGHEKYVAKTVHVMNLKTGQKQDIQAAEGEVLRVLGFVGNDFMYGKARPEDSWINHGRTVDLPMYMMEIVDDGLNVETHYEKTGYYISDVRVEDSRIHLNKLSKISDHEYAMAGDDIIVCTTDIGPGMLDGIGWYASEDRRKVYFVQSDEQIKKNHKIKVTTPKKMIYDEAGVLNLKAGTWITSMEFYAYGSGKLLGSSGSLSEMVGMAYDKMGFVTDENHMILWNRINRPDTANIKNPEAVARRLTKRLDEMEGNKAYDDGIIVLDARKCTMHQMLYFIGRGCPVVAYMENGEYVLLYGYDQYNVSIYRPSDKTTTKMGLKDGEEYFKTMKNDFICGVFTE